MDDLDQACDEVRDEIIRLRTQLRWTSASEELWSSRYADLKRDRDRLRYMLDSTQDSNSRWEEVAREMQDERDQLRSENIRLRRLVKAFVEHQTEPCQFDRLGDCRTHMEYVGKVNGACAVALGTAWLHQE